MGFAAVQGPGAAARHQATFVRGGKIGKDDSLVMTRSQPSPISPLFLRKGDRMARGSPGDVPLRA